MSYLFFIYKRFRVEYEIKFFDDIDNLLNDSIQILGFRKRTSPELNSVRI